MEKLPNRSTYRRTIKQTIGQEDPKEQPRGQRSGIRGPEALQRPRTSAGISHPPDPLHRYRLFHDVQRRNRPKRARSQANYPPDRGCIRDLGPKTLKTRQIEPISANWANIQGFWAISPKTGHFRAQKNMWLTQEKYQRNI